MKSPFSIFALAMLQILLLIIISPIILAIVVFSLLNKRISLKPFFTKLDQGIFQNNKPAQVREKKPKQESGTTDVEFNPKKH